MSQMPDSRISVLSAADLLDLVTMSRELAAVLNLRTLLPRVLARACELTDSPDGSIILYDPERGDLFFAEAAGHSAPELLERWGARRERGIPVDGSKAGQVYSTGVSLRVDALTGDEGHFKGVDADTRRTTQSMICVPLTVGTDRLGVMQLLNKRTGNYSERDLVLLEHFADQAAVALRNATLVEDVLAHMGWYESPETGSDPVHLLSTLRRPAHSEELTVMFADMRGYNRLCQELERPEEVQTILNEFLTELARGVLERAGIVNKFLGDGLLAIFRGEQTAERAVRCALDLTTRMGEMRERWDATSNVDLRFLDIGMGIATEKVILGSIGTARVRDFTVLGTGVNLAAHLTRDARQGRRILVDKRTYRSVQALVTADGPETFELKKPDQPQGRRFERYSITGLASPDTEASTAAFATPAASPSGATRQPEPQDKAAGRDGIFISYSHHDSAWLDRLQLHLTPSVRKHKLAVWDDTRIKAGAEWRQEITQALERARVAVLLVSPHFLASEFITSEEWPALLAATQAEGLTVIWFVVSACLYEETTIPTYQAALDPRRPLDGLAAAEQNQALVQVCRQISEAFRDSE